MRNAMAGRGGNRTEGASTAASATEIRGWHCAHGAPAATAATAEVHAAAPAALGHGFSSETDGAGCYQNKS
jgi:hypothetical protein